jgi:hypothetical protein
MCTLALGPARLHLDSTHVPVVLAETLVSWLVLSANLHRTQLKKQREHLHSHWCTVLHTLPQTLKRDKKKKKKTFVSGQRGGWLQEGWSLFVQARLSGAWGPSTLCEKVFESHSCNVETVGEVPDGVVGKWPRSSRSRNGHCCKRCECISSTPPLLPSPPGPSIHPGSLVGFWPLLQPRSRCRRYYPKLRSPSCKGDGAATLPTCTHCTVTCTHMGPQSSLLRDLLDPFPTESRSPVHTHHPHRVQE